MLDVQAHGSGSFEGPLRGICRFGDAGGDRNVHAGSLHSAGACGYQIAKLLSEDCRYAEIVEKTGTSTATISRVNRSLSMVSSGGYAIVFDRLKKQEDKAE